MDCKHNCHDCFGSFNSFSASIIRGVETLTASISSIFTDNWLTTMSKFDFLSKKDPKKCKMVSRELHFTSSKQISNLRLRQRIKFRGKCIEEWMFNFGFVIWNLTYSWQQVIKAATMWHMMSTNILRGYVLIDK